MRRFWPTGGCCAIFKEWDFRHLQLKTKLTRWRKGHFHKTHWSRNSPHFIAVFTRACYCHCYGSDESNPRNRILFLKAQFTIIIYPTLRSSKLSISFRFSHQNPVRISLLPHMHQIPSPFSLLKERLNESHSYSALCLNTFHFRLISSRAVLFSSSVCLSS